MSRRSVSCVFGVVYGLLFNGPVPATHLLQCPTNQEITTAFLSDVDFKTYGVFNRVIGLKTQTLRPSFKFTRATVSSRGQVRCHYQSAGNFWEKGEIQLQHDCGHINTTSFNRQQWRAKSLGTEQSYVCTENAHACFSQCHVSELMQ